MSALNFDTDAAIQRLKGVGLSEQQAREFVHTLRDAQVELVTVDDMQNALANLERDLKIWTGGVGVALFAALAAIKYFG